MTDKLRAATELALEALEQYIAKELTVGQRYTNEGQQLLDATTAIRTALAEQPAEQKELDPKDIFVELVAKPVSGFAPTRTNGVRLTHRPTGISVEETDERSPHKNKHIAWEKLKQLVSAAEEAEQAPNWTGSNTLPTELWKNPLYSLAERLEMADGAVDFERKVVANLRKRLAEQPAEQEPEHITDGTPCWCEPETVYTDPETNASVIVHRRPQ